MLVPTYYRMTTGIWHCTSTGRVVSRQTLNRRRQHGGLHYPGAAVYVPLTRLHRFQMKSSASHLVGRRMANVLSEMSTELVWRVIHNVIAYIGNLERNYFETQTLWKCQRCSVRLQTRKVWDCIIQYWSKYFKFLGNQHTLTRIQWKNYKWLNYITWLMSFVI